MYRCSVSSLYESCTSSKDVWEILYEHAPATQATCVAFQDRLLVIFGGTWCHCYNCKCNKPTKNIYEYDDSEESGEFKCIGSTPEAQYLCLACTIDNTIFIAGGAVTDTEALKNVYILTCM